jgi:hypothetical protein
MGMGFFNECDQTHPHLSPPLEGEDVRLRNLFIP